MKSITYRAPAKVILSGEHSVVYGKPALISGLALYCTVTVSQASEPQNHPHYVDVCKEVLHSHFNGEFDGSSLTVEIQNEIPLGRGLGSSAAFSVACIAAMLHWHTGTEPDKETINSLAYRAEKKFHHNPSGADNTTSCFGGLIYFRKEFEFLKTISALNSKLPQTFEDHLLLIDTGAPAESTAEMVKAVSARYNKEAKYIEDALNQLEKSTRRMVVAVVSEDASLFRSCIADNQPYLERLGIVSGRAKNLLSDLSRFGTGKITGAGGASQGSGYALFYADDRSALESYLTEKAIAYLPFHQDIHGVLCKKSG